MSINFKKAVLYFVVAYLIVTILCYSLGFIVTISLKLPSAEELGVSTFADPSFLMTVPYQLLINLIVWTSFCWLYFRKDKNIHLLKKYITLGCFWLIVALIFDLVAFVLIKSPFSFTPYQFYVEYQPWISITYFIVFISPLFCFTLLKFKEKITS